MLIWQLKPLCRDYTIAKYNILSFIQNSLQSALPHMVSETAVVRLPIQNLMTRH